MLILPDFLDGPAVAELLAANARYAGDRRGKGTPWTDCPLAAIAPHLVADLAERAANALHDGCPHLPGLDPDYVAYTVMLAGASHTLHADAVKDAAGTPNHTPHRVATAMLYLGGPADFAGGQILFPGLGVAVEPRPGTLVAFLCDWRHRHQVERVTRGERHALALWFKEAR